MEQYENKSAVYRQNHTSTVNSQFSILNSSSGFSLIELIVVLVIISVLLLLSYSTLRTPKERIVCRDIFSAMQLAKMRTVSTNYNTYIDFDMDGGNVSDGFYTVYLDTDNDSSFGEINNKNGDNEFAKSQFAMQDSLGGYPGVALPSGIAFGLPTINPPSETPTGGSFSNGALANGVGFAGGSKRVKLLPKGIPSGFGGSVYVHDVDDSIGRACAVVIASTGIIRMWTWDGKKWN